MTDALEKEKYDVEIMNLVVDKADNLKVVDCDSHFCEFAGVHLSKVKQGKIFLHDIIIPTYREKIMKALCKKNSPYVYFSAEFYDKYKNSVLIHCSGQNFEGTSRCRLTLVDLSKTQAKQKALKKRAKEMNYLVDLVNGGVCLFVVDDDMHINVQYINEGGCRLFGTTVSQSTQSEHGLDELIHPEDRSAVFQAIGRAMATDEPIDLDIRTMVHKNEYRWCNVKAGIQYYDKNDRPVFHAMFTDITRVKQAEEKADALYEHLFEVFKNLPNPVFSADTKEPMVAMIVSEDFIKFFGHSRAQIFDEHGGRLSDFMNEREQKFALASIKRQIDEGKKEICVTYSIKTGKGKFEIVEDRRKIIDQDDGTKTMLCSWRRVDQQEPGSIV